MKKVLQILVLALAVSANVLGQAPNWAWAKSEAMTAKVNIQHLPSGIYFAKITNANGVVEINKVVKR